MTRIQQRLSTGGRYHRLRVGLYRIIYTVDDDLITIDRVDRVSAD